MDLNQPTLLKYTKTPTVFKTTNKAAVYESSASLFLTYAAKCYTKEKLLSGIYLGASTPRSDDLLFPCCT